MTLARALLSRFGPPTQQGEATGTEPADPAAVDHLLAAARATAAGVYQRTDPYTGKTGTIDREEAHRAAFDQEHGWKKLLAPKSYQAQWEAYKREHGLR